MRTYASAVSYVADLAGEHPARQRGRLGAVGLDARRLRPDDPWRRARGLDFDNGIVLVNPKGNGSQTVSLGATFTKLKGTQDPAVNDGSKVTSVTLADRDGIILKR